MVMNTLPPEALVVISLADQVCARLVRGDLAGRIVAHLGARGAQYDAEFAARLALADVKHWLDQAEGEGRPPKVEEWHELAAQLRAIEQVASTRGGL
jgi:hypothetical protein